MMMKTYKKNSSHFLIYKQTTYIHHQNFKKSILEMFMEPLLIIRYV